MRMEKARIIVYDDWGVMLDETETFFASKEQLEGIVKQTLNQTHDGEVVEAWVGRKLKMKFQFNRKHKIVPCKNLHPGWGGRRDRAGAPSKGAEALVNRVVLHVNEETFGFCESLGRNKAEWIRQAISEKREREGNEKKAEH